MDKRPIKEAIMVLDAKEVLEKDKLKLPLEKTEKTFKDLKICPQVKIILK